MKTTLFYLVLLFSCSFANSAWAQVFCPCQPVLTLSPDPADPCCYFLNVDFSLSPGCGATTNFTQIEVNTNVFGGTGIITGATSSAPGFSVSHNTTLATFSTSPGFISATPTAYVVGRICFSNSSAAFFPATMTISNGPNDNCAVSAFQDDLTTTCSPQPPCCLPLVSLVADPTDPCCRLINVSFPNPASCMFPTSFNQITVATSSTGIISNATGSGPFSPTVNGTATQATFTTSPNFITPLSQTVGRICFANYTTASFPVQLVISNSTLNPDPCAKTFSYNISTPCLRPCSSVSVPNNIVCSTDETLVVPLIGCSAVCGRTQVRWYVQSPCGTGPWQLYQVKPDCSPLTVLPNQYTANICIYAEVLTTGICDCPLITSNIATIQLCAPFGCSIQDPNPDYCDCGTPAPIVAMPTGGTTGCVPTFTWYNSQGTVVGNTASYTPPPLCFTGPLTDCYQDYTYKVVIHSACGDTECSTTIRVYNKDAPKGKLEIFPIEAQPFCPGEDATLLFTPGCAGDPKMWDWYLRPCIGGSPTHLTNAGTMNNLYNTNKLYQSVWYYVQTQNGVCPLDTVQLKIEVKEPPLITSFTGISDPCVEQYVNLSLNFQPCTIAGCAPGTTCTCSYTVDWYKDGYVIGTTTVPAPIGTASFSYLGPEPFGGNYYAVLKDDCCPGDSVISQLIQFRESCDPGVEGPCCICNGVPILLEGYMVYGLVDPCQDNCTYTWYEVINGIPVVVGTGLTYWVTHPGIYIFESNCNGCIKQYPVDVPECTNNCSCGNLIWADFWQEWNNYGPIDNTAIFQVPCPDAGRNYFIHGDYTCVPNTCGSNLVNWELTRPGGLLMLTGASIATYPHFDITLPWADCIQPGIYTLKIIRHCGLVPCTYTFMFEVKDCGCLCSELAADVALGFQVGPQINCKRSLLPKTLDPCDIVSWTVDGNPVGAPTTGNSTFFYDFGATGSYTVCMTVTRTEITGATCTAMKCQTVSVSCFGDPNGLCVNDAVSNGNFTAGVIRGHLGGNGAVADWQPLPGVTDGAVFADDSPGGYDDGYLVLAGGLHHPAAVYQALSLTPDSFTLYLGYNRRNFSGNTLPVGTKLEFRLYADSSADAQSQLVYTDFIESSVDTGWVTRINSLEVDMNPDYPYLAVLLTNGDTTVAPSIIGLDNLEICSSPSSSSVGTPVINPVFRLFPNPATNEITIEWTGYDGKNGSIHIFSSLGQLLQTQAIPDGAHSLKTTVGSLPEGIYFVKIMSAGRPMKVLKFVKS